MLHIFTYDNKEQHEKELEALQVSNFVSAHIDAFLIVFLENDWVRPMIQQIKFEVALLSGG